jgi:aminoglycoside 6-adenylyltransferase
MSTAAWLAEIAEPWLSYSDPVGITRHVLFEGGLDAGIAPLPENKIRLAIRVVPLLKRLPFLYRLLPGGERLRQDLAEAADYYRRGARAIVDKRGLAKRFLSALPAEPIRHSAVRPQEYLDAVNEFWLQAVWTAKHLRRGELWYAKTAGCDGRMKTLLLRMMEWHVRAAHGWNFETWEDGRFLEEWADRRAVNELNSVFARYDVNDVARGLLATMDLFRWLAMETAHRLNIAYPLFADERATECVTNCLAGGDTAC